ncbi:MAG: cytochrome c3 family protein [Pseudobdellovibrionaceae bacterium]
MQENSPKRQAPFSPASNLYAKIILIGVLLLLAAGGAIAIGAVHSPYLNGAGEPVSQPIEFSHQHHVQGLGLDCRYCHVSVEKSAHADYPDTATCITCHSQIWTKAPLLQPVRDSFQNKSPLRWIQIHQLPDFVYFDHSAHLHGGIGCVTCHGVVSKMPALTQVHTFFMKDCLDCHQHPEKFIRPREELFNENWKSEDQISLGSQLIKNYQVRPPSLINCSGCHR